MKDYLQEARKLIMAGEHQAAMTLLDKFQRKNKIEGQDRITLSGLYRSIGKYDKAFKALGPLILTQANDQLSQDELNVSVAQARLLNAMGCKFLSGRLFFEIDLYLKQTAQSYSGQPILFFYNYFANTLIEQGHMVEAREMMALFKKSIERAPHEQLASSNAWYYYHETSWRIESYLGNFSESDFHLEKLHELIKSAELYWFVIYHNRKACQCIYQHDFTQAREQLDKTAVLLQQHPGAFPGEQIFWYRMMAQSHIEKGENEIAVSFLQTMLSKSRAVSDAPEIIIGGFYYMDKIAPQLLTLGDRVALRNHPNSNYFSYLAGRALGGRDANLLPFWCREELPGASEGDCWIVQDGAITAKSYLKEREKILALIAEHTSPMIDLVSGIVQTEEDKIILSDVQHRTLLAISGAGSLSVDKWSLMEFVYRQTFLQVETGLDRLAKVVTGLRKMGLDITLTNNDYRVDLSNFSFQVFPMIWHQIGIHNISIQADGRIDREVLEKHLGVKASTAKSWLTEWKKKGLAA
ncbi:MAG: hypothetical protein A2X86_07115 [Bdellovibrionales bacterium GWA2_49_15]|nr:MAG: hypothetical protein A2X86_07115 [Bdellovibrionales bacterium GWA2_49_15]HAZ11954.1 hypothetical protein [Bdellovibrionales bacterium]